MQIACILSPKEKFAQNAKAYLLGQIRQKYVNMLSAEKFTQNAKRFKFSTGCIMQDLHHSITFSFFDKYAAYVNCYGEMLHMQDFRHFDKGDNLFVFLQIKPFLKIKRKNLLHMKIGPSLKGKNLLPMGANSFLLE